MEYGKVCVLLGTRGARPGSPETEASDPIHIDDAIDKRLQARAFCLGGGGSIDKGRQLVACPANEVHHDRVLVALRNRWPGEHHQQPTSNGPPDDFPSICQPADD
jgi:hypothetical protein